MPGSTDLVIRRARPDEYATVGDLVVEAYRTLPDPHDHYEARLRDVATRAVTSVVLVAESDGRLVGTVTYVPGPGPDAEVQDPMRRPSGCSEWRPRRADGGSARRSSRRAS